MSFMKKSFVKILYKSLINKIFNPFVDMNVKPLVLNLKKTDKCLVIAPHPDDESIGCGGIMALNNTKFKVICLTHGENPVRNLEFNNAMDFLGVEHEMLNLKDKHIIDGEKEFENINFQGFNYIFIPYIFDQHKDHKAVSLLLEKTLQNCKPDTKIVFYEVWSAMNMPNYFVDISTVIEKKKAAINFHQSQVSEKNYSEKITGLNKYRGMLANIDAAETFTVLSLKDFKKIVEEFVYDQN